MASVLGQGSSISQGFGIGLSAVPDNEGYRLAASGIDAIGARRAREGAAKKKTQDDIKGLENFKIPVVNPIYQGKIENSVSDFHNTLFDLTKSNDPDAYWKGKKKAQETSEILSAAQESSKNADIVNQTRYVAANNKDIEPSEFGKKFLEEYDKSVSQKSPTEEFKKIVGNEQGFIPESVTQKLYQPKPFDFVDAIQKSPVKPVIVKFGDAVDAGDVYKTSNGVSINLPATKAVFSQMLQNPETNKIAKGFLEKANGDMDKAAKNMADATAYKVTEEYKTNVKNKPKEFGPKEGAFKGNTWMNDKVRVQYNDINGVKTWDFSGIKSDNENKALTFTLKKGQTVSGQALDKDQSITGVPVKFVQEKGNVPPQLVVSIPAKKDGGIVTEPEHFETLPYDIGAPKVEDEYGFNPYTIEQGVNPDSGKQRTTKGDNRSESSIKKGDTKTLSSGKVAVFDGTKWILK